MRTPQLAVLASLCLLLPASLAAQQSTSTATSDPQTVALLQQSLAVLTGGAAVTDVTMTGTITITKSGALASSASAEGYPTTESDSVTLVATSTGQSQTTAVTSSGTRRVTQDISSTAPTLTVIGADGDLQKVQTAAALTPHPAWFYPTLVLASGLSSPYAAAYVGHETRNGIAVEHIAIWWTNGSTAGVSELLQRASQHDIYLDSASLLPVAMTFVTHFYDPNNPDKPIIAYRGNSPDRLTEVQFSDYRQVQGRPVAFHIRSAMTIEPFDTTSDFVSDIQISSVSFNTGAYIAAN